jgi:GNAT superfamily N-acetyltransferase
VSDVPAPGGDEPVRYRVRSARPDEAQALTALCLRSKAHWGYDADFMCKVEASGVLAVTESLIRDAWVNVAEDDQRRVLGVVAVRALEDGAFDLWLLFVDPFAMRNGVGRELFGAAVRHAARRGGKRLAILSDPFAAPFYERLGARKIRDAPSDAIPGRLLPLFEFAISGLNRAETRVA